MLLKIPFSSYPLKYILFNKILRVNVEKEKEKPKSKKE